MAFLSEILGQAWAIPLVQFALGKLWKSHPELKNDLIPLVTFIAAAVGLQTTPAMQGVTDPTLHTTLLTGLAAAFTGATTLVHQTGKTVFTGSKIGSIVRAVVSPLAGLLVTTQPTAKPILDDEHNVVQ